MTGAVPLNTGNSGKPIKKEYHTGLFRLFIRGLPFDTLAPLPLYHPCPPAPLKGGTIRIHKRNCITLMPHTFLHPVHLLRSVSHNINSHLSGKYLLHNK